MAQYDITGVNYVSSGSRRGLLDLKIKLNYKIGKTVDLLKTSKKKQEDEQGVTTESGKYEHHKTDYMTSIVSSGTSAISFPEDSTKLLLNERQSVIELSSLLGSYNYDIEHDNEKALLNPPQAIELKTEERLKDTYTIQDIIDYNNRHKDRNCIFEFEKMAADNEKTVLTTQGSMERINPLNDMRDVMLKSMYKKGVNLNSIPANPNIPKNIGQASNEPSKNYNVDMYLKFDEYPIQFCQYKNYSWMVTTQTANKPYILSTDLHQIIKSSQAKSNYQYQIVSEPMTTNLYGSHDTYGVSCYRDYFLSDERRMEDIELMKFFTPQRRIGGIKYNYIVNIDQTGQQYLENPTIYDDGNVPGSIYTAKNMYNSTYSVDMDISSHMANCRQYSGIQKTNRGIILKFFDNVDYTIDKDNAKQNPINEYPYQKIEMMIPIRSEQDVRHKSNLFSIKIKNSGLEQDVGTVYNKLAEKMKKDITNNIFKFTSNICPANTQLFDVYYTE